MATELPPGAPIINWDECREVQLAAIKAVEAYEATMFKHFNISADWALAQAMSGYHAHSIKSEIYASKEAIRCALWTIDRMMFQAFGALKDFEKKIKRLTGRREEGDGSDSE